METSNAEPAEVEETEVALKCILHDLKDIKLQLARQEELNRHLNMSKTSQCVSDHARDLKSNGIVLEPPTRINSAQLFSMESRTKTILHEALRRYKSDLVPSWSTLYGTNLARGELIEDQEAISHALEWTSITGHCWKIPNDNRVSFCFLAPLSDEKTLVQVRKFLFDYHKSDSNGPPKGENFNIWDWFGTGISAYWFPGKRTPSMPFEALRTSKLETSSLSPSSIPQISPLIAPWRRIINLQGLTTLEHCEGSVGREEITDGDLCPFLITDNRVSIFQRPIDEMIGEVVKCHLRCLRISSTSHAEMKIKDCVLFHVTFYEILQRKPADKVLELWPCGDLHSDDQRYPQAPRQMREAALTIIAVPSREIPGSKPRAIFWTMICLRPSQFPHLQYSEQGEDKSRCRTNEMVDVMSDLVHQSLVTVVSRWDEIARYFDEILTEKKGLLNPDYHDSLLTDDKALSRSKKYFWAIEFLKEAGNSISDNIQQTKRFLEFLETNPPGAKIAKNGFHQRVKKHYLTLHKLESLEVRFRQKKEEAVALRDGLFSASTVMDSRASNELGQNIKLLTFVSIFFTPLSFCASIWSVNNSLFSISAFAITMAVVGICTYIVVFNLNRIAAFFTEFQSHTRDNRKMNGVIVGNSPSSLWSFVQFNTRLLFSKAWNATRRVRESILHKDWKAKDSTNAFNHDSLRDLGNVHVKVQVDVESCSLN